MESVYLKLATDFITSPLTYSFNLSLITVLFRKSAFVVPLLKEGDSTILDNYRPISKLCVLSKILESLISDQLTCYLNVNKVLSINQSGFRKTQYYNSCIECSE